MKNHAKACQVLRLLSLAAFVLAAAGYAAAVVLAGGSAVGLLAYPLAFALVVVLPGLWLAGLLLPGTGAAARTVLAVPLGAAFLLLLYAALTWFLPSDTVSLLAFAVGAVGCFWQHKTRKPAHACANVAIHTAVSQPSSAAFVGVNAVAENAAENSSPNAAAVSASSANTATGAAAAEPFPASSQTLPAGLLRRMARTLRGRLLALPPAAWLLLLLFSLGLVLNVFMGVFPFAKASAAGNMTYNQDLLWSVGNAAAAPYGMPVRDMRAATGVLHYHYFVDILSGLVAQASGQTAWDAVCYYIWPLYMAALLASLYLASRRFGTSPAWSLVAPLGVLLGSFRYGVDLIHLFPNPNGVLQCHFFMVAAVLLLQEAHRTRFACKRQLAAFGLVMLAMVWGKSTVGVLMLCAVAAALVVYALLQRRLVLWLVAALGLGAAAFAAVYFGIYQFAINNLIFQPTVGALQNTLHILLKDFWPATLLYVASLVVSLVQFKKLTVPDLVVNALVPGGLVAVVLFYHYSASQGYFLTAGRFMMWLCIARALPVLCSRKGLRAVVAAVCAVAVAGTLFTSLPTVRKGVQVALRCLQLRPQYPYVQNTVSPHDAAAAAWLRENMAPDEVFATNRNAQDPAIGEGVFHYYTAASGRQAFVESWRYAMDYSIDYHLLRHNLETVSDGIFACATYAEAAELAAQNQIDYLVVHLPFSGHAFEGGTPAFANEEVLIYRVG